MAETPRTKIAGDYICEKCERHDHSDHAQGWGGICIGCSCSFIDKPASAETPREPDRFDARCGVHGQRPWWRDGHCICPELRAAESEALERAAYIAESYGCDYAGREIRALKPDPAAAPAAETRIPLPIAQRILAALECAHYAKYLAPEVARALADELRKEMGK